MSFFKVNTESAAKVEGGNFINQSGIYDVTIKAIIVILMIKELVHLTSTLTTMVQSKLFMVGYV